MIWQVVVHVIQKQYMRKGAARRLCETVMRTTKLQKLQRRRARPFHPQTLIVILWLVEVHCCK